jgi:hypothetical protein
LEYLFHSTKTLSDSYFLLKLGIVGHIVQS